MLAKMYGMRLNSLAILRDISLLRRFVLTRLSVVVYKAAFESPIRRHQLTAGNERRRCADDFVVTKYRFWPNEATRGRCGPRSARLDPKPCVVRTRCVHDGVDPAFRLATVPRSRAAGRSENHGESGASSLILPWAKSEAVISMPAGRVPSALPSASNCPSSKRSLPFHR